MIQIQTFAKFLSKTIQILMHHSYLFLNLDVETVFRHVDQRVFAAGVQHPLPDATLVPRHRINEDCKRNADNERCGHKEPFRAD